jgi:flagellar motor switch protein FliG
MDSDDLVRRVRDLAATDPAAAQEVEKVVADALAALEKATGTPFGGGYGEPPVRVADLVAEADRQRTARTDG